MTSPTSGSTVSATTTVSASVSIIGSLTVSGVQFKLDGANLGAEDTSAPYSIPWDTRTASNGSHTLAAVARDGFGVLWTSGPVTVTVFNDLTPPTVSITSPAAGADVRGTITMTAGASDNVGVTGVQFKLDGANVGAEDTTAPYSLPWDTTTASSGSHALTAIARDAAGNSTTSASVSVIVDNSPPTVGITSPAAGSIVAGSITVSADAADNIAVAGVQFFVDGAPLGAEDVIAPFAAGWDTVTATDGSHTLTARARDAVGNTTTTSSVIVTVDNSAPAVTVTSPAAGSTVSASITVSASASDNVTVASVRFFADGAPLGVEDTTEPYAVSWNTTAASNGSHSLTAVARDAAGNTATSATVAVTVLNDTTAPTVTISSPASGATLNATVSVTAAASDDVAVTGVQFFVDGAPLGAEDTAAPHGISWDTTTATDGTHTLTAAARDGAGNTTLSAPVSVTVANSQVDTVKRIEDNAGAVTYTVAGTWMEGYAGGFSWSGGTAALGFTVDQRATLTFAGTAVSWIGFRGPQTGIANVYLDGALVATIDPYSPTESVGAVLYTASGLAAGSHTLAIEVTRTKNEASSDYFVVVDAFDVTSQGGAPPPPPPADTTPPTVSITAPTGGSTVSGIAIVAASASDNVSVAGVRFFVDGVQVGAEDTTAPYEVAWNTSATSNGAHTLTALARDGAANTTTSAAVNVTVSNTEPPPSFATTRIEDTELAITYTPGTPAPLQPPAWYHGSRSRDWSSATSTFNRSAGARATIAFNGTSISWIGFRAFWAGIARVYLDGVFLSEIDLFLPPCTPEQRTQGCIDEDDQVPVFTASGLAAGPHTFTVEVTGTRNAGAADNAVVVDGFDVGPASPPTTTGTRIEDTAMSYTSGWTQGETSTAWSGGTAAVSATAGARATVTFVGTEVRWIGRRGPQAGIARIFLDGGFQAEVDQYFPTDVQGLLYTATGLAPGNHTLTIEVSGLKNKAATGIDVAVDAVDVRSRFEDGHASATYSGVWMQEYMDRPFSGTAPNNGTGTAARSATAGAVAEFTFSGSEVRWISSRAPNAGIVDVFVDGLFVERVDLYAATEVMRAAVVTATGLGPGPHTLRIEVTGLKNDAATGAFIFVDAFDVVLPVPAPTITRIQQTDALVSYTTPPSTTGWAHSSPNHYFGGQTVAFSTTAASRATFTFTGTAVRWIGQRRRDAGIARVYIDGVLVGDVDTFTGIQDEFQARVFSATGLASGVTHSLTIEVTGTKRGGDSCTPNPGPSPPACSAGYVVVVDAFEIF